VTSYYTLDRANARLPEVREILEDLQVRRAELIATRDRLREVSQAEVSSGGSLVDDALAEAAGRSGRRTSGEASAPEPGATESPRVLTARMQAIIDQMQAAVERLDGWDVTLRDIETGLVDFPALVSGRQVWLCWRLGEDDVAWWHELSTGIAGRRPLSDLE
jgi:hypothetical protein